MNRDCSYARNVFSDLLRGGRVPVELWTRSFCDRQLYQYISNNSRQIAFVFIEKMNRGRFETPTNASMRVVNGRKLVRYEYHILSS